MAVDRKTTLALMKSSWNVLKNDKSLMLFPLVSGICLVLVSLSLCIPAIFSPEGMDMSLKKEGAENDSLPAVMYVVMFLFYIITYFIGTYFNTALTFCTLRSFNGEDTSFKQGISEANNRLSKIFGWALLASSIGLVLRIIEDRVPLAGKIVTAIFGIAFSVVSYLVVPVMVVENKGPVDALKESAHLFQKTWGKQIKLNLGLGAITTLLCLPVFALVPLMLISGDMVVVTFSIIVMLIYSFALGVAQSALSSILRVALYIYARDGNPPKGFNGAELQAAIKVKE